MLIAPVIKPINEPEDFSFLVTIEQLNDVRRDLGLRPITQSEYEAMGDDSDL